MTPCNRRGFPSLTLRSAWRGVLYSTVLSSLGGINGAIAADAVAPPAQVQFGGQCTEALAEGRHVMTACATTWTDKDGKAYCFSGDAAKKSFLENPNEKLQ